MSRKRPPLVAVCGPGAATPAQLEQATTVGRLLARRGAVVVNGGLDGVMQACAAGVAEAGGMCIGLLPGMSSDAANDDATVVLPTGLGELRNALIARSADALIAIGGGWGTLSEVALAMRIAKPVVLLDSWTLQPPEGGQPLPQPMRATSAEQAVALAIAATV